MLAFRGSGVQGLRVSGFKLLVRRSALGSVGDK